MVLEVKHPFQSAKGDGPDTSLVQPTDWNALHSISQAPGLLGNPTDYLGPPIEIPLGAGMRFTDTGTLESTVKNIPIGVVLPLAGNYEPAGWLICDGRAVSRDVYSLLYGVVQDKFGLGDGITTFNIPDMRGRVPAGKDNLGGTAANRLTTATFPTAAVDVGKVSGTERHILTLNQLAKHKHGVTVAPHRHFTLLSTAGAASTPDMSATRAPLWKNNNGSEFSYSLAGSTAEPTWGRTSVENYGVDEEGEPIVPSTEVEVGLDEPHLNLQPTITMNYIIWSGVMP